MLVLTVRDADGHARLMKARVQAGIVGAPRPFGPKDNSELPRGNDQQLGSPCRGLRGRSPRVLQSNRRQSRVGAYDGLQSSSALRTARLPTACMRRISPAASIASTTRASRATSLPDRQGRRTRASRRRSLSPPMARLRRHLWQRRRRRHARSSHRRSLSLPRTTDYRPPPCPAAKRSKPCWPTNPATRSCATAWRWSSTKRATTRPAWRSLRSLPGPTALCAGVLHGRAATCAARPHVGGPRFLTRRHRSGPHSRRRPRRRRDERVLGVARLRQTERPARLREFFAESARRQTSSLISRDFPIARRMAVVFAAGYPVSCSHRLSHQHFGGGVHGWACRRQRWPKS